MIIDTTTRDTLEKTLCDCFYITPIALTRKVEKFKKDSNIDSTFQYDIFVEQVRNYIITSGHKKI